VEGQTAERRADAERPVVLMQEEADLDYTSPKTAAKRPSVSVCAERRPEKAETNASFPRVGHKVDLPYSAGSPPEEATFWSQPAYPFDDRVDAKSSK